MVFLLCRETSNPYVSKSLESDFLKTTTRIIHAFLHFHILHYLFGMFRLFLFASKALPTFQNWTKTSPFLWDFL